MTVKDFSMAQRSVAVAMAAVEGAATIHGHDPIAKRNFTLVITRHYEDRRVDDGWALESETQDGEGQ